MDLTQRGESAHDLFQAQAHVWNHIFHFITSMSLKCAVELSIPDIIHNHGRPMTISELVDAVPVEPSKVDQTYRLMRLLVHSGFFDLQKINGDGEEGYVLTPSSRFLLKESSTSLSTFLSTTMDPVLMNPWQLLSRWFQGKEETAMETFHGMGFWEYMPRNTKFAGMFNVAMANDSRFVMKMVVEQCGEVFKGVGSVVDVGGGTGESAMAIAKAFPHIKCTVLDLPHVVATVSTHIARDLDFVGGDMFESIPKADVIFLKWILHDWSDEECVMALKRCKEAIPSREEGGKVIIVDVVVLETEHGDPKSIETQLYWDFLMMVIPGGKERDECEWRKIFMDAGFSEYKIVHKLGLRSLIELYP